MMKSNGLLNASSINYKFTFSIVCDSFRLIHTRFVVRFAIIMI